MIIKLKFQNENEQDRLIEFNKEDFQKIEIRNCRLRDNEVEEVSPAKAEFYGVYIRFKHEALEKNENLNPSMHLRDFIGKHRAVFLREDITTKIRQSAGAVNEIEF